MRRISTLLVAGLCAGIFSLHTPAQAAAEMSLMRLADCGTPQAPVPVNERLWTLLLRRFENSIRVQLLSHQTWRPIPAMGYR